MSDLVGNPEDRFSHNEAHIIRAKTSLDCCSSRSTSSDSAIDTASPLELANRLSELESELM